MGGEIVAEIIAEIFVVFGKAGLWILALILYTLGVAYVALTYFNDEIESKTILVSPKIKLHTDGNTIDSTYIYKIKP